MSDKLTFTDRRLRPRMMFRPEQEKQPYTLEELVMMRSTATRKWRKLCLLIHFDSHSDNWVDKQLAFHEAKLEKNRRFIEILDGFIQKYLEVLVPTTAPERTLYDNAVSGFAKPQGWDVAYVQASLQPAPAVEPTDKQTRQQHRESGTASALAES